MGLRLPHSLVLRCRALLQGPDERWEEAFFLPGKPAYLQRTDGHGGLWTFGGLNTKQDSFCTGPGRVSPPSLPQTLSPRLFLCMPKKPCGLWSAFSRLGWAGNQQENQIRAAGRDKMASHHIWAPAHGCQAGPEQEYLLARRWPGYESSAPGIRWPWPALGPVAVQVMVLGTGSRDEVTFPDSAGIWAVWELWCVSCPGPPRMGHFASLEQVVASPHPHSTSNACLSQCHRAGIDLNDKQPCGCSVPQFPCW